MSGVIPMVSSSPPPFDDEEGDDWDEDFGNFMGAGNGTPEQTLSQDWAAFPESGSSGTPAEMSSPSPENKNSNTKEGESTKAMELKLDAKSSSFITSSDSGLDLDSNHATESVSQRGIGSVPHIDSGLFSSEVSPSEPIKNAETGNNLEKKSTLSSSSSCDSTKHSTSPLAVLNEDSDSDFSNFESNPDSIPVVHSEKNSEIPVQAVSSVNESGSTSSDMVNSSDKINPDIPDDEVDDWGDFGDFNENSSASPVLNNEEEESEKSKTGEKNTVMAEHVESSSGISNSYQDEGTRDMNVDNSSVDFIRQQEDSNLNISSMKDSADVKDNARDSTSENLEEDKTFVTSETDENLNSDQNSNKEKGFSVEEDESLPQERSNEEVEGKFKDPATSNETLESDCAPSDAKNIAEDQEEFNDFANFDSGSFDEEQNEKKNQTTDLEKSASPTEDEKEEDFDDSTDFDEKGEDFDDFADFDYAAPPISDTEGNEMKNTINDRSPEEKTFHEDTTEFSQRDNEFNDFADFDYTAPSIDETEVKKENSTSADQVADKEKILHATETTEGQGETTAAQGETTAAQGETIASSQDDDFDDFADFDSAPLGDTEDGGELGGQFAAFTETSTEETGGNWAAFQETSESSAVKDDWTSSEGGLNNKDSSQWKDSGEEEWKEGGEDDDFGDFGDFDDQPPMPKPSEKVRIAFLHVPYTLDFIVPTLCEL